MSKKIRLTFGTSGGNKSSLSIDDPRENLDEATVRTAMGNVISAEVFEKSIGDSYASVAKAVVIETNETVII